MGGFHVGALIESHVGRKKAARLARIPVDKSITIDEALFAQKGDLNLLEARTLEGLNPMVNSAKKKLAAAGPFPAA